MDNLSRGTGEEVSCFPCPSSIHSMHPAPQQWSKTEQCFCTGGQAGTPGPRREAGEGEGYMTQGGFLAWRSISSPRCCNLCFRLETPGSRCWPPHKMQTAKESRSGGAVKEEIFVLIQLYYLPELVIFGSMSLHTQQWHAQWHFEPSLGLLRMIAR